MNGFGETLGGDPLDPRFADFCKAVEHTSWDTEAHLSSDSRALLTGKQIADALDAIESGTPPVQAAQDAWANRGVA